METFFSSSNMAKSFAKCISLDFMALYDLEYIVSRFSGFPGFL